VPCSADEARAASAVLCAGAGILALLIAAVAAGRFPETVRPAGGMIMGIGAMAGPVLLLGFIACALVRMRAVDRHRA
jgi:hypothetical protein